MIGGSLVVLRAVEQEDIKALRAWRNLPEVRRNLRAFKEISGTMQQKWYDSIGNNSSDNHIYFAIDYNDCLVGVCGLHYINWCIRSAEASVMIAPDFSGKGIATDAIKILVDYAFGECNLNKVFCEILSINTASLKVFERVGFKKDGVLRDNFFVDGKYFDSYLLSVLKSEWVNNEE